MVTLVCGFGRCGSSLVMQILDIAGLRCAGVYPAFEVDDPLAAARSGECDAVKWLDPRESDGSTPAECRAIWLGRNPKQQARSAAKFLAAIGRPITPRSERGFREAFTSDRSTSLSLVRSHSPGGVLELRFEALLSAPIESAEKIAAFIGCGDPRKMAGAVFARAPECLPGLLEAEMVRHGKLRDPWADGGPAVSLPPGATWISTEQGGPVVSLPGRAAWLDTTDTKRR